MRVQLTKGQARLVMAAVQRQNTAVAAAKAAEEVAQAADLAARGAARRAAMAASALDDVVEQLKVDGGHEKLDHTGKQIGVETDDAGVNWLVIPEQPQPKG